MGTRKVPGADDPALVWEGCLSRRLPRRHRWAIPETDVRLREGDLTPTDPLAAALPPKPEPGRRLPVPSDNESVHRDLAESHAEMASPQNGALLAAAAREETAGVTAAILAIYHELRHNDLGGKLDKLTEQVTKIALWQSQRRRDRGGARPHRRGVEDRDRCA